MIEAIGLSKQFERTIKQGRRSRKEEFLAVDQVSLKAGLGEIVGILGPNGAGNLREAFHCIFDELDQQDRG